MVSMKTFSAKEVYDKFIRVCMPPTYSSNMMVINYCANRKIDIIEKVIRNNVIWKQNKVQTASLLSVHWLFFPILLLSDKQV